MYGIRFWYLEKCLVPKIVVALRYDHYNFKISEEDLILGKWFSCFWIKAPIILDGCNLYDFDVCLKTILCWTLQVPFTHDFRKLNSPHKSHHKCVSILLSHTQNIMISKLHVSYMWPWWGSILSSMSNNHNDLRFSRKLTRWPEISLWHNSVELLDIYFLSSYFQ